MKWHVTSIMLWFLRLDCRLLLITCLSLAPWKAHADYGSAPEHLHALMDELLSGLETIARQEDATLDAPRLNDFVRRGSDHPRILEAAQTLGLNVEKVFVALDPRGPFNSRAPVGNYVLISELIADFGNDRALLWHLAHEFGHIQQKHGLWTLAVEFQLITARCPSCFDPKKPKVWTLMHRSKVEELALRPLAHQQEFEADAWAVRRLLAAGVQIENGYALFRDGSGEKALHTKPAYVSNTHPTFEARIGAVDILLETHRATHSKDTGSEESLSQ